MESPKLTGKPVNQVYLLHNFANCSITENGDLPKLADFFLILKCLKHPDSAVICVFFVRSMDLRHRICQWLILPWLFFAFQIVVECLSADLQSFAVKKDFSDIFAVIGSICNIVQSLLFPDF